MISAILDTNVILQSVIGEESSASVQVVERYFDGDFELFFSEAILDELIDVLSLERLRPKHGFSDDEILEYVNSLLDNGRCFASDVNVSAAITRDITDTKFLALAQASDANYLVTNDARHLQPIGQFAKTKIVSPGEFLEVLKKQRN